MEEISLIKLFLEKKDIFEKYFIKKTFSAGEIIFKEGSIGDTLFLIEKGNIVIEKALNQEETDFKELAILSEGNFFGEISVVEEKPRTAQAKAIDESILYEIKRENFFKFISDFPEEGMKILLQIMKSTMGRLQHTSKELTLLFDISRLLTKIYTEEKDFLKEIVNEVSFYFEGQWNISSYFYNYFNDEFEKAGENYESDEKELTIKPDKTDWINENTYCIVVREASSISAYMVFKSKQKLSLNQKNDWSTIFNTISYILSSGLKEIKKNKELIMLEKLKNSKNII